MIVIKPDPDFVLTPGRYALVLNGLGYDFTVAGPITAPEHCLEQVDTLNGAMLSECVKTNRNEARAPKLCNLKLVDEPTILRSIGE